MVQVPGIGDVVIRCVICEEFIAASEEALMDDTHVGSGEIAEMYNPANPEESGIVHAQCGINRGWEIS